MHNRLIITILLVLLLALPAITQDEQPPPDNCAIVALDAATAYLDDDPGEFTPIERLDTLRDLLATEYAVCAGYQWSGTGDEQFRVVDVPDGFYTARLEISAGGTLSTITTTDDIGACDFWFLANTNFDSPDTDEALVEFDACEMIVEVATGSDVEWTFTLAPIE